MVIVASIDEMYLDLSGCERLYGRDGDENGDKVRRGRIGSARLAGFPRCPCHVGRPSP